MPNSKRRKKLPVFLSHTNEDKPVVRELYHRLKKDGFSPWLDEEQLLPGQDWDWEIEQAMRDCVAVLLCFSERSVSKEGYIQREYKKAMDLLQEKPEGIIFVIPVRLDQCGIPRFLSKLQCVDFPAGYEKLVLALHRREGKPTSNKISKPQIIKQVQLVLEGDFKEFDIAKQQALVSVMAALLGVEKEHVRVLQVYSGSVIVKLEMPEITINRLRELAFNSDFRLKAQGIISVQIEGEQIIRISNATGHPRESVKGSAREQEGRTSMSENGVRIGGNAKETNIVTGNENMVVQIINHVYNKDDLMQLVRNSFPEPVQLMEFWAQTFPAVDPKLRLREANLQAPSVYEELVDDFKRNNEVGRLLGEIKKRSLTPYRDFLASQVLAGIGLSAKEIPMIDTDAKTVEAELRSLQRSAASQRRDTLDDALEFEDRSDYLEKIRFEKATHIVLHGPSGVGKTHFLEHLQEEYEQDTCCTFIDLKACKPQSILPMVLKQLSKKTKTVVAEDSDEYLELATLLSKLLKGSPPFHRFYFLFDNADQNQAAIDYLFSPENPVENEKLHRFLKGWKLLDSIQLKIVIAARHPVIPSQIFSPFSNAIQIKFNPLKREYVQNMLEKIVVKKGLPIDLGLISKLSDEVYYLAGGHPKCTKQMLLALAERGCVVSSTEEWQGLYKEHVITTIQAEMLQPIDFDLLPAIWNLSVFRRFDQRLLGGLLDRGILPSLTGDKSRRARELRAKLESLNLFDVDLATLMTSPNYVMRRALSLNMQLNSPDRYQMLNSLAVEMYLDRIQGSEAGAEKQVERMAINLLELLYHWIKLLEIEALKTGSALPGKSVCTRIREAFENYLLLSLTMIQDEDRPVFSGILKARWGQDTELQEAIQRVTASQECLQKLRQLFETYGHSQDDVD